MYLETMRFITEEFQIILFAFDYGKNDHLCSFQYFFALISAALFLFASD